MTELQIVKGGPRRGRLDMPGRFAVLLAVVMAIAAGACASERVDSGPVSFAEGSLEQADALGVSDIFDAVEARSFTEQSKARVLVSGVETYQHLLALTHQQNPRAFAASLLYPAGGASWQLAIDSGSLSQTGGLEIVAIDGLLYQNAGAGWDADGFVGVAFGLGPSPLVAATQAFSALPRSVFLEVEQIEIAGLAVPQWHSVDPAAIARMWLAVTNASGSLAPTIEADQIVPGSVDVSVTADGLVAGFQYSFGATVAGEILRVDGFAQLEDIGSDVVIADPTS